MKTTSSRTAAAGASPGGCPVVGIGCSTGGVAALEEFFAHVPASTGIAFVVVQHLEPGHPSGLSARLKRATSLPVVEVDVPTPLRAECVFVAPPGRDLALRGAVLVPEAPAPRHGAQVAVDFLLRSLAGACGEASVGVLLSGMGADGVLGLRAIQEAGGLTLAQEPSSAVAAGMPMSAIATGIVDVVARPGEMPARIVDFLQRAHHIVEEPVATEAALPQVLTMLRERCGADFSSYKTSSVSRRIERRLALHQLPGVEAYSAYLREHPLELDLLFKELLIGVTSFFRDAPVWDALRDVVWPELFARNPAGRTFRAWIPACSSGEEAYSLAIVFREALAQVDAQARYSLQIYATDLDPDAIARARKGIYPANIAVDVSAERLERFFVVDDEGFRVAKEIRDLVVFAPQNIISDPPFTRLDILSCRNLLIYFQPELQRKLVPLFHYALNPGGVLMLGSAESVGGFHHLFAAHDGRGRIFRKIEQNASTPAVSFVPRTSTETAGSADATVAHRNDALGNQIDELIRTRFMPAAVLVNADGDILYFSGRTGKYLEPAAGKVNVNLHAMARDGLREALVGVIGRALREPGPIVLHGLRVGSGSDAHLVDVTVQAIEEPLALRGRVIVVFQELLASPAMIPGPRDGTPDAVMLELQQTREALRITREEMQGSFEDLKSANEELQSTNEELQSTNEELTTSKEEMQALNEELQTVNAELQAKVDDLTRERNDMTNLLNSTEVATVFLDNDMKLRRFTSHATRLFKLIPGDVGRPLSDLVSDLEYPTMLDDAREVLKTLVFREQEVRTHDGRWYRVRIMPYRTQDNVIDGVVGTFLDITEMKKLERELRDNGANR